MKDKQFIKGTVWNTLGSTAYGANSFIMLMTVSRMASVADVGCFGIAFTTAQILYIVGLLGINHYQQTDYRKEYNFLEYSGAKLFSSILMLIGFIITVFIFVPSREKVIYTGALTVLMLTNSIGDLYQNMFFQNNRLDLSGSALFFRTLFPLIAFVCTMAFSGDILFSIVVQILVNVIVTTFFVICYGPLFGNLYNEKTSWSKVRKLIIECSPLFVSFFLMNIVINISKYGIEFLMNDEIQGYYNMIFITVQVINLCSQFIYKPLLNQYANLLDNYQIEKLIESIIKLVSVVFGITLICIILAFLFGVPVLDFMYGQDLFRYRNALVFVVFGGGLFAIGQFFYYIFVILRQQKLIMTIYICGFVFSAVLSYLLIIKWGINGAAFSFVASMFIIGVMYIVFLVGLLKNERHK